MRFPFKFSRRVGAGADPVLGSDVAPTTHANLTDTNVFKTELSSGAPSQRIAIAYSYTGAGPAPTISVKGYIYDGTQRTWFTVDSLGTTLKPGDIAFIPIPQLIDPPQLAAANPYESSPTSVEFALVATAAGGEPAGTYTFLLGSDISEVVDEASSTAPAAHVIVDGSALPAGAATEATLTTLALEATLQTRATEATLANVYARQADGNQKSVLRGGAKGATVAADVTSTAVSVDRQAADVAVLQSALPTGAATEATLQSVLADTATIDSNAAAILAAVTPTEDEYTVIKNWTNQLAETEPPASLITLPNAPKQGIAEVVFVPGFTFPAGSPNWIRFKVWHRAGASQIVRIDDFVVQRSDLELAAASFPLGPRYYNINTNEIQVTVTFLDGTSPTITGIVRARSVTVGGIQNTHFPRDFVTGIPYAQSPAHDGLTRTDKVTVMNDLYPAQNEPLVISETSLAIGTHYHPSTSGIELGKGYNAVGARMSVTGAGGTSATSTTTEVTIDGTNWDDVTITTADLKNGGTLSGPVVTAAGSNVTALLAAYGAGVIDKIRWKTVVSGGVTGAVTWSFRKTKEGAGT